MIRTIIIDDEPSAINVLSNLLHRFCKTDVEVVATTQLPEEGRQLIEKYKPDLVFLDIEMPGLTGIDLVKGFANPGFRVVFVTAYDAYAVEAFRLSAVDYLLKPIGEEEIVSVIGKIKNEKAKDQNQLAIQLEQLNKLLGSRTQNPDQKLAIVMADKIVFVNFSEIIYCEAQRNYTHLHLTDNRKLVSSKTLSDFENQLGESNFLRIHHHYLINLGRVKEYQRQDGGYVVMEGNRKLEVSQRRRKDFLDAIQHMVV